jgi:hypothetical protein
VDSIPRLTCPVTHSAPGLLTNLRGRPARTATSQRQRELSAATQAAQAGSRNLGTLAADQPPAEGI